MTTIRRGGCLLLAGLLAAPLAAQGVREHTRLARPAGTTVSEAQAADLTLTLSSAESRLVQTWIRTAGVIDGSGKGLTAYLSGAEAALVQAGQRARAFPPSSKSSMYQARITRAAPKDGGIGVEAALVAPPRRDTRLYVLEIVVERGPFLSIANESIIEEGDRQVVYVLRGAGQYVPQQIRTGIQGELYTQVLEGLAGGEQVVTFGSFFIDAEQKLKATDQNPPER